MEVQYRGCKRPHQSGIGLIEIVVSIAILSIVAAGIAVLTNGQRFQSANLADTTSCDVLTSGITGTIKAYDNTLVVRNWLQKANTNIATAAQVLQDPFCKNANGRTPVCDTFGLFSLNSPSYADFTSNYQNIRGAFTWAQSVYNLHRQRGICNDPGIVLTQAEFQNILPTQMSLPPWVTEYRLYVKDQQQACGQPSNSMRTSLELKVTANYGARGIRNPATDSCASVIAITSPSDSTPPTLTIQAVRNLAGTTIPPGACTDLRTVPTILNQGVGTDWQTIFIDMQANEPGSILACRKAGLFEQDTAGKFRNCPDMPVGGQLAMAPSDNTITYNVPLQARVTMSGMPDRGQDMHIYEIKAVDVGGNESTLTDTRFRVHTPSCIPRDQYCANAAPVIPPTSAFTRVMDQPYDDCLNGLCPQGTHRWCDPAQQMGVCQGQFYDDDCGQATCPGQLPQSCAGIDLTIIPCGVAAIGQCGAPCGVGTFQCGGPPVPSGTPAPGCDCNGVDLTQVACGAYAPDSCNVADVCGPGTQGCPPATPAPWTGTWGPYQCTRRNGTSTCASAQPLPGGWTNYRFTIWFLGSALDNEPWDSNMRVTATVIGATTQTYSRSGSGAAIGPYNQPHSPMPGFPSVTFTTTTGGQAPTLIFNLWVEDASVQAFWTMDAW
ncbi:MAG: prepilin-type N-terminal cleavage/methylation domain-containing protein [Bdellovibrionia bacterium]